MKKITYLLLLLLPSISLAQPIEATILSHWDDPDIVEAFFSNQYHDVWGTVVNGNEYGIITSTDGFHIFDLSTQPLSNEPVAYGAASIQGGGIGHRDIKTYGNYLYAIADEGNSALQIFDLSDLPNSIAEVYVSDEHIRTAHNLFIDEDNARLYAFRGKDGDNFSFTIKVLSLTNPELPTLMAEVPVNFTNCHDGYVRDNIAYLHIGSQGMVVLDLTSPSNPITLGALNNYPDQGYSHSGWLSEDGDYYVLCEETVNKDVKIVDVSDFSNMEVVVALNAEATGNQIPHNCMIRENLLYISYYSEGLQVFDISNPLAPIRVAYYDSSTGITGNFVGAWGVFVLPSGKPLLSDMQNGFYAFDSIVLPESTSIYAAATNFEFCMGTDVVFPITIGSGFDAIAGVTLTADNLPTVISVNFSENPTSPGTEVLVSVTTPTTDDFEMIITADDGTVQGIINFQFGSLDVPVETANLLVPENEASYVYVAPDFSWEGTTTDEQTIIQLSTTGGDDFENGILWSVDVDGNSYTPPNWLDQGTVYYWRVVSEYACENGYSDIYQFFTTVVAVEETFGGNEVSIFPNPATDAITLQFEMPLGAEATMDLFDGAGKKIKSQKISLAMTMVKINTADLANGMYLIQLRGEEAVYSRRVIIGK